MGYQRKRDSLERALRNNDLSEFLEVVDQNEQAVFYQGKLNSHNMNMLFSLWLLGNSLSEMIVTIGVLENRNKKEEMLDLFNEFNQEETLLKFCIDKDNYLQIHTHYIADENNFDGEIIITLLRRIVHVMEEKYNKKIMRVIWA